jgi:pSer/pThr/pTyr-binding forkhead associated (FHA) protein
MLEDLGSTNGTMVNGYPISSTVVTPRDVVVIGDCRMSIDIR